MLETYRIQSTDVRVKELPKVGRSNRTAVTSFQVRHLPFEIQPFFIAPVLPGETMKNLLLQATAISDPLVSGLLGWWNEYYFFYVKLRDLPERAAIEQMLIANAAPPAATAADPRCYYAGEGVNWVRKCLDRIVETYFRSEDEIASLAYGMSSAAGMPNAKMITNPGWMENLVANADAPASDGTPLPGDHWPELPEHLTGFADAYAQWKEMQSLELTAPSFEDYLKTFGIRPPAAAREELHRPELLRYVREFTKPKTQMVSGTASSIVSWDTNERADKDRFFSEPGFVVGITTTRAKMYAGNQKACMASFFNDAYSWLPALLRPDPFTSLKKFAFGGDGPLNNQTEDYWVDMADVLTGGDQFLSLDPATANGGNDTPIETGGGVDILKDYAQPASINGLFVDAAGGKNLIRKEGRVDMNVLTSLKDSTPA